MRGHRPPAEPRPVPGVSRPDLVPREGQRHRREGPLPRGGRLPALCRHDPHRRLILPAGFKGEQYQMLTPLSLPCNRNVVQARMLNPVTRGYAGPFRGRIRGWKKEMTRYSGRSRSEQISYGERALQNGNANGIQCSLGSTYRPETVLHCPEMLLICDLDMIPRAMASYP